MQRRLTNLAGATVRKDGNLVDSQGKPTGLRVPNGGHELVDDQGRVVGTVMLSGAIYDRNGTLVARVTRKDG